MSTEAVKVSKVEITGRKDGAGAAKNDIRKDYTFVVKAVVVDAMGYDRSNETTDRVIYSIASKSKNVMQFTGETGTTKTAKGTDGVGCTATGVGTETVTAYLEKNPTTSASVDVTVVPNAREAIQIGSNSSTDLNLDGITTVAKKTSEITVNDGATALTPEELKAKVTDANGKDASDKVTVAFKKDSSDNNKLKAEITALKDQVGTYSIIVYTGDLNDTNALMSKTIAFAAKKSEDVKEIQLVESFGEGEVSIGKDVTKKLKLINIHDEEIVLDGSKISVTGDTDAFTSTAGGKTTDGSANTITINGKKEGTYSILIHVSNTTGTKSAETTVSVTIVSAAYIDSMTIDKVTRVINNDGDANSTVKVSFKDQYGYDKAVTADEFAKLYANGGITVDDKASTDNKVVLTAYKDWNAGTKTGTTCSTGDSVKYVGIKTTFDKMAKDTKKGVEITFKRDAIPAKNEKVAQDIDGGMLSFSVDADRVLSSLEDRYNSSKSYTATVGATVYPSWAAKDQYGDLIAVEDPESNITFEPSDNVVTVSHNLNGDEYTKGYGGYQVSSAATGTYNVTVKHTSGVSLTIKMTVKANTDIASLSVNGEVQVGTSQHSGTKYDTSKGYLVKASDEAGKDVPITNPVLVFTATAKDSSGASLSIKQGADILWSIKASDLKTTDAAATTLTPTISGNAVTIPNANAKDFSGTITVVAKDLQDKISNELTVKVSTEDSKIVNGTYFISSKSDVAGASDAKNKVTKLDLTDTETAKTLYVFGVSQYGETMKALKDTLGSVISEDKSIVAAGYTEPGISKIDQSNTNTKDPDQYGQPVNPSAIVLSAMGVGSTNVSVVFKNEVNTKIVLPVTTKKAATYSDTINFASPVEFSNNASNATVAENVITITGVPNYNIGAGWLTTNKDLLKYSLVKVTMKASQDISSGEYVIKGIKDKNDKWGNGGMISSYEKITLNASESKTVIFSIPSGVAAQSTGIAIDFNNDNKWAGNTVTIEKIQLV